MASFDSLAAAWRTGKHGVKVVHDQVRYALSLVTGERSAEKIWKQLQFVESDLQKYCADLDLLASRFQYYVDIHDNMWTARTLLRIEYLSEKMLKTYAKFYEIATRLAGQDTNAVHVLRKERQVAEGEILTRLKALRQRAAAAGAAPPRLPAATLARAVLDWVGLRRRVQSAALELVRGVDSRALRVALPSAAEVTRFQGLVRAAPPLPRDGARDPEVAADDADAASTERMYPSRSAGAVDRATRQQAAAAAVAKAVMDPADDPASHGASSQLSDKAGAAAVGSVPAVDSASTATVDGEADKEDALSEPGVDKQLEQVGDNASESESDEGENEDDAEDNESEGSDSGDDEQPADAKADEPTEADKE